MCLDFMRVCMWAGFHVPFVVLLAPFVASLAVFPTPLTASPAVSVAPCAVLPTVSVTLLTASAMFKIKLDTLFWWVCLVGWEMVRWNGMLEEKKDTWSTHNYIYMCVYMSLPPPPPPNQQYRNLNASFWLPCYAAEIGQRT